jgi:hypothetical protein
MLQSKSSESFNNTVLVVSEKCLAIVETKSSRSVLKIMKPKIEKKKDIAEFRPGIPNKDLKPKEARILMKSVRASVSRYIKSVNFQVPEIRKEYPVIFTNRLFWESIPDNTDFYIIDAKHAYWRIAFIHGYIKKGMYEKYADNKEIKAVRNIALAILNSTHKCEYYRDGQKIHECLCDTSLYSRVYNNIRYFSYNLCGQLRNDLDDACFAYRTDGVFLLKPGLHRAKKIFEENNLLYKIEKCVKIDNKSYSNMDGELKRFV